MTRREAEKTIEMPEISLEMVIRKNIVEVYSRSGKMVNIHAVVEMETKTWV